MIPDDVLKAFDNLCFPDKSLVWVATTGDEFPHLVPVCFVKALERNRLLIGNVFIKQTEKNIEANQKIAVGVAFNEGGWDGYMIKGKAIVRRDGETFETFKKEVLERTEGKRVLSSTIEVLVEEAYSLQPRTGKKRLH
jgi:predicted pyridoxine 5'-phosphate oxidase superfamily flavin-nucleotide-binding protein